MEREEDEEEEYHPLLFHGRAQVTRRGDYRADGRPSGYRSFDNPALSLHDEETHLTTEDASSRNARAAVSIHTASVPQRPETIGTVENDVDTVSILTLEDRENDALGGEEILFRLRLAHIHGNQDWVKHLRRLPKTSSEGVHMELLDQLREMPIDIHQKKKLSRYLRDRLDAESVHSLTNREARGTQERRGGRKIRLSLGLWSGNIGKISAYFGSHVASYFVFLRFLVYLDVVTALLLFGLLALPQILSNENAAPEGLSGDFGLLSSSVMFFGAYSDSKWGFYDRPLAYLLTWASVNIVCFLVIVASMYIKYSVSKRSETKEDEFPFSVRVFSSWDHTLSRPEGAVLRAKAIVTHTKEMVREKRSREKRKCWQKCALYSVRGLMNLVVLAVLVGSAYFIYLVADNLNTPLYLPDWLDDFLRPYKLPLVVAALKMLVPPLLYLVIRLERWAPRTELKLMIVRTWLFYVASLVVLLLSMYDVSSQCVRAPNATDPMPQNLSNGTVCCWENEVGEEVLKVMLIDLGQILLTTFLLDYLRAALIKCGHCSKLGYREFTVASEVLDVIYGQSLVWLGIFFSPLLAAVGSIKLIILFYFRYVTARMCSVPPRKVFRASRSGNFFLFILLLNFFVCLFTMTYAVIELEPSYHCGPFKSQDHVYAILTSRVGDLPHWLRDVIVYVSTPAIVVPFILFLLLGVLYYKAKSASYVKVINKLREQLRFERRVQKREVFARARYAQGPQLSAPSSVPQLATRPGPTSSTRPSAPDITTTTTTTITMTIPSNTNGVT